MLKPTYEVVKSICSKCQDESGSTDFYEEIKSQKYRSVISVSFTP
ncbi:hypothetical protein [Prochlorococcus sp. RSP50]|nr:hypothetical protein [Prochlorococcus sp. RS50]